MKAMIMMRRVAFLSLAVCWTASVSPGQAQDAEKAFYAGKTVRMIVGSGVGGGYDVFSRLIAPYLGKTLGATVIVENVPGAGGLVALNKLYIAPADGLQISLVQGTMASIAQLTDDKAARGRPSCLAATPGPRRQGLQNCGAARARNSKRNCGPVLKPRD